MTNHVHLLFKVGADTTLSDAMHWISSTFARRFNKLAGRWGHLWEGRFRSTIIEQNTYFFRSMAYLDLNPVRAGMAVTPLEYRWSGHRSLRDEDSAVLDFHPLYLDGGADAASRYRLYMKLLGDEAARPPTSLATKYFVGSPGFVSRMESRFGWAERRDRLIRETRIGDDMSDVICAGPRIGRVRR